MPIDDQFVYDPPTAPLEILYEDDDLIIVNKPAGLLSVMGRLVEHRDSAYWRILQHFPNAKVTHRLDMATSGILVFAKHRDVEVAMSRLFQQRAIQKTYTALVQGELTGQGIVDVPLITDWENRPRQKIDYDIGKSAQTQYRAMQYIAEYDCTEVKLHPITGRSHQLRVHMLHLGHPIVRDKIYNPQAKNAHTQQMALHASQIEFIHPLQKKEILIKSSPNF
ncbi:pseudouridine synthase [Acinetobacter sp. A3.8]|uniref:Pseudouridine synthase n=1 Tax=Acinetobacter sedimenti TaxID=2919922 RepID=A0A9X2B9H7_9GAMM|nr:pseudouridine synthase [Acinetobacter sedimenti]MCJ8147219.1 pseudouridine synthase [Acinetobacter sedimenti]